MAFTKKIDEGGRRSQSADGNGIEGGSEVVVRKGKGLEVKRKLRGELASVCRTHCSNTHTLSLAGTGNGNDGTGCTAGATLGACQSVSCRQLDVLQAQVTPQVNLEPCARWAAAMVIPCPSAEGCIAQAWRLLRQPPEACPSPNRRDREERPRPFRTNQTAQTAQTARNL